IHRIGQREICRLWNFVAADTREGDVYARLLDKLEIARKALGGRVYDVLGRMFEGDALRDLLVRAIRYGENPEHKMKLLEEVEGAVDQSKILELLNDHALTHEAMGATQIAQIRDDMERASARRLQPHFIQSFFMEAFQKLDGKIHRREEGRWEITRVPSALLNCSRRTGAHTSLQSKYERICFEKDKKKLIAGTAFVCPGHPLLDAVITLTLARYSELMRQGTILIDETDSGDQVRVLFYLEHAVHDGRIHDKKPQVISQRLEFVEFDKDGTMADAGPAPYLDYRPVQQDERELLKETIAEPWLGADIEQQVIDYAIEHSACKHLEEIIERRLKEIDKV
ncbi:MAG: RNA helicase, partial [Proteobacteria bacterium]|nr:RNA helicase [Pseudomonadota bacterium]